MPLDLEAKSIVLVTGATGPLGKAFAIKLAANLSAESCLVLSSRSRTRLGDLKDELERIGTKCQIGLLEWDLKNPCSKQFRTDLEEVTNSVISYAGLAIRLKSSKFSNAVVVHNAASIGNMQHDMLEVGRHEKELMESFAVNVVAPAAITTAFFEVFHNATSKVVVDLTAPSADNAYPSFGYTSMAKSARKMGLDSARKMGLDVLAKEHPSIRVLHFNPVAVDTPALRHIRDQSHDQEVRDTFHSIYAEGKTYSAEHVAETLVGILGQVDFQSGEVIGANEVQVA
uniref:NAD(P)-binding protein n=1 Tax=Steinernema glaseri TaxID=37863 RepID=A0A1I7ZRB4_9BILA